MVVSADPHFSHHIFLQEGRSVEMWYLDTFSKLFGQDGDSRTNAVGAVHKYVRSITLSHFGSEILKTRAILQLEEFLKKTLHSWSACSSVEVKHASAAVNFQALPNFHLTYYLFCIWDFHGYAICR